MVGSDRKAASAASRYKSRTTMSKPPVLTSPGTNGAVFPPKRTARKSKSLLHAIRNGSLEDVQTAISETITARLIQPGDSTEDDIRREVLSIGLAIACDEAKKEVVAALLQHGADPNFALSNKKVTALLRTAQSFGKPDPMPDHWHIIRILLRHGADPNLADANSKTPLMYSRDPTLADLLLDNGADIDARDASNNTALMNALVEHYDNPALAEKLIDRGADVTLADDEGRSTLVNAAWRNHASVVKALIDRKADVTCRDVRGRNIWHHLAGDSKRAWDQDSEKIMDMLMKTNHQATHIMARDMHGLTCLHHAAINGCHLFADSLLKRRQLDVNVVDTDHRLKTPLHLAVEKGMNGMVAVLLKHRADVNKASRAGWRPLHMACKGLQPTPDGVVLSKQDVYPVRCTETKTMVPRIEDPKARSLDIFGQLLGAGADVSAATASGMTPFHLACERGSTEVVSYLSWRPLVNVATRDSLGNTPLLAAASGNHHRIVELLAPWKDAYTHRLSDAAKKAAEKFQANVVNFGPSYDRGNIAEKLSVYDVLYGDPNARSPRKNFKTTMCDGRSSTKFRWIHLPVNHVNWCQELLKKRFVEECMNGEADTDGSWALAQSFKYQHRGEKVHSSYMRPMCHTVRRAVRPITPSNAPTRAQSPKRPDSPPPERQRRPSMLEAPRLQPPQRSDTGHVTIASTYSNSLQPPYAARVLTGLERRASHLYGAKPAHNAFLFAPYLHFETDEDRRRMQEEIKRAGLHATTGSQKPISYAKILPDAPDELLVRAHFSHGDGPASSVHFRRTLDQSFYRNIDTEARDNDQIITKYEKSLLEERRRENKGVDPDIKLKVLMVDQLWMWILGDDLVITSFPQRWRQPPADPLNVLETIVEEINLSYDRIDCVHELALLIAARCFGTFDGSSVRPDGSRFLDMFESSIGKTLDDETKLFKKFEAASTKVSQLLKRIYQTPTAKLEDAPLEERNAIQTLLDIGDETQLVKHVKDIRDELDMLRIVFEQQKQVMPEVSEAIETIFGQDEQNEPQKIKIEKRITQRKRTIQHSIDEIARMDKQAERIYSSLRDLLDLKQKHANAVEASYARYQATATAVQAAETARQGQTLMVFTIVTVIFLPLSFIAAFFAINIQEFPHVNDNQEMSLTYVSKYVFGIGLSIAVVCVIAALSIASVTKASHQVKEYLKKGWRDAMTERSSPNQIRSLTTAGELDLQNRKYDQRIDEEALGLRTYRARSWKIPAGG